MGPLWVLLLLLLFFFFFPILAALWASEGQSRLPRWRLLLLVSVCLAARHGEWVRSGAGGPRGASRVCCWLCLVGVVGFV